MPDAPLPKMVSAVFPEPLDAVHAMDALATLGYARTEMNILMTETGATFQSEETRAAESDPSAAAGVNVAGMGVGTAVGAVLGSLAAVGLTLAIPPLGLLVAGPLVAGLVAGGAGAATGALVGGYGLPDPKEPTYAEALKSGGVIVGVAPHDRPGEVAAVEEVYRQFNGQHIFHGGR